MKGEELVATSNAGMFVVEVDSGSVICGGSDGPGGLCAGR
jgi:hypothetical protein